MHQLSYSLFSLKFWTKQNKTEIQVIEEEFSSRWFWWQWWRGWIEQEDLHQQDLYCLYLWFVCLLFCSYLWFCLFICQPPSPARPGVFLFMVAGVVFIWLWWWQDLTNLFVRLTNSLLWSMVVQLFVGLFVCLFVSHLEQWDDEGRRRYRDLHGRSTWTLVCLVETPDPSKLR